MSDEQSLLQFPCDFPVKIIGSSTSNFISDITAIILNHYPTTLPEKITHKPSDKGNFTAITVIVHAIDKPGLDAFYMDLTQHPDIKMVL